MKKILYTILCGLPMMVMAQKKVGINTDTPSQTLDVEGTMRIANPGPAKVTNIPLAWGIDNQQVIKGTNSDENKYPFYYATFKIDMSKNQSDFADMVDLKIDTDKYVAVLTQAYLVDDKFSYNDPSKTTAMMRVKAKNRRGTEKLLSISSKDRGFVDDYNNKIEDRTKLSELSFYKIAIPIEDTRLVKDETAKTYKFFGDYAGTNPLVNKKYSWIINVLIIDKEWVKVTGL